MSENPVSDTVTMINSLDKQQLQQLGNSLDSATLAKINTRSMGGQVGGVMRKLAGLAVLLLIGALIVGLFAYLYLKQKIASGERNSAQASWGYTVEQYQFRNRMRLNLWSDSSLFSGSSDATFDLDQVSVIKLTEERWLADSRAVYLNLVVNAANKLGAEQTAKVIYDFQRGEMYTFSPVDLWRVPGEPNKNVQMSEAEFQSVLNKFSGQIPIMSLPLPNASIAPGSTPSIVPIAPSIAPSVTSSPLPSPSASPGKVD